VFASYAHFKSFCYTAQFQKVQIETVVLYYTLFASCDQMVRLLAALAALLPLASALMQQSLLKISSGQHLSKGCSTSMLFESSKGMPPLYDGWFKKTGYIDKSIVSAVKSAAKVGSPIEVLFPSVPNLDEVLLLTLTIDVAHVSNVRECI
jgi:hypothetical protein